MARIEVPEVVVVAGLGCRAGCLTRDIFEALTCALQSAYIHISILSQLYALDTKRSEAGLHETAVLVRKPLAWLSLEQLRARSAEVLTHSPRVQALFGVPSVAETAALAGAYQLQQRSSDTRANDSARPPARLLGPRVSVGAATCALAAIPIEAST